VAAERNGAQSLAGCGNPKFDGWPHPARTRFGQGRVRCSGWTWERMSQVRSLTCQQIDRGDPVGCVAEQRFHACRDHVERLTALYGWRRSSTGVRTGIGQRGRRTASL